MTSQQMDYAGKGAATGAIVGGGIGCAVAAGIDDDDPTTYAIGCPIGVGVGAVVGGLVGYLMAPKPMTMAPPSAPPALAPPPPPPPPPPAHEKILLRGVRFAFNEANISDADKAVLDDAAAKLKASPGTKIEVNGFCDAIGSEEYNLRLSRRRADAVASYLEEQGISPTRLIVQGFGKSHFVASNDTADGRAQNRRVELVPVDQ